MSQVKVPSKPKSRSSALGAATPAGRGWRWLLYVLAALVRWS